MLAMILAAAVTAQPALPRTDVPRLGFFAGVVHQCTPGTQRDAFDVRVRSLAGEVQRQHGADAAFDFAAAFGHGIASAAVSTSSQTPLLGQDFCGEARRTFEEGAARLGPDPRRQ
ncbi:hypothetical protein [Phenylobacterium sp.]|jgi:hypothetical protein|uniref:hypothetical protein n=1 Tax=Phenylobacterium sp. TaxID=1871053 RepID=UPI0025FF02D3|nr:hypothetical protein [Phenylobacterium sp.]MCA3721238.1 hypothetical protein [Phenylobacterium sp.]